MADIFGSLGVPGGGTTAQTFGTMPQMMALFGGHPSGGNGMSDLQRLFLMQSLLGQGQGLLNAPQQPSLLGPMLAAGGGGPDVQQALNFMLRSQFVG